MDPQNIANVAPATRKGCAGIGASSLLFGLLLCLDGRSFGSVFFGVLMLAAGMVGMVVFLFYRHWTYGVEEHPDGFFFKSPLRRVRFIPWSAITRVTAHAIQDSYGESAISLRISSLMGSAWLSPELVRNMGITSRIQSLPGFDQEAWSSAHVEDDKTLFVGGWIPKRTVLYARCKK